MMKARTSAGRKPDGSRWLNIGHRGLILELVRRDIAGRYRGSAIGIVWSLLTPLFMLGVYTFVFGTVLRSRWTPPDGAAPVTEASIAEFALILFAGLTVFQLFSEVISRAPTLILAHQSYVKKIVFPLEILPAAALGSALFHTGISLLVLLGFLIGLRGAIPLTAMWLPVVLAPFSLLTLGLAWFLASLGVYYRDINQILGSVVTTLMFLSPIFFPPSAMPGWVRPWIAINPIAWPVEQTRAVLLWGVMPDLAGLGLYTAAALTVAVLGYVWFQKTRKGFADVL